MSKFLLSMLESRAFWWDIIRYNKGRFTVLVLILGETGYNTACGRQQPDPAATAAKRTPQIYITAPQPETAASLGEIARRKRAASRAVSDPLSQYSHAMLASYRGSGCGGGDDRPRSERA